MLNTLVSEAPSIGSLDSKKISDLRSSKKLIVPDDSVNEIMVLVKEKAVTHDLHPLFRTVKKQVKEKWRQSSRKGEIIPAFEKSMKNDLKSYVWYCTQFSWRIVTQVPPLKIDYKTWSFNPSDHNESQAFTSFAQSQTPRRWADPQEQTSIKCYVWPTLYDWDQRVIEKGDVVLKGPSLPASAV